MTPGRLSLVDLPWLPRAPETFRASLDALGGDPAADWGPAAQQLATHHLSVNQATSLARKVRRLRTPAPSRSLARFKLGLLSHGTTDFIVPVLEAAALRHGIQLEVVAGAYGQAMQECLDPSSALHTAGLDAVLLAFDHRGLPFRDDASGAWPPHRADEAIAQLDAMRHALRRHGRMPCLVQTIPTDVTPAFGSLDAALSGSLRSAVLAFNAHVVRSAGEQGDVVLDVDWLAQSVGLYDWHDERDWLMARMPFSQRAVPAYADLVARTVAAMRGKARKCLVLDLDNTVWGGVIGDDGLDGIALNQGDARGEAHRAVQAAALDLRRRGVVLAVCSKNDDATARQPFRSHPGMLLKEDDIAVFVANWEDKATNLERIAQRLEIGLDALVFLDDNPVERSQVRQALPQVAVPEIGADPSTYVRTLLLAGYFESVAFTPEDLQRAEQYQGNARRLELQENTRDLGDFLRSLDMKIQFAPFGPAGRKRITQLINKTNQFNVCTRRYTEPQVAEMETSAAHYTLQVGLTDRFGDNGMICVIICHRSAEAWDIDSWLMSCRVLNRKVEESVCNRIARDAVAAGATRLLGRYIPTARNAMVADLYARLGFERLADEGDEQRWGLDLTRFTPFDVPVAEDA